MKNETSAEPFYVAQTFEPEHAASPEQSRAWWGRQVELAKAEGGTFFRYSVSEDDKGLLFECWKEQPKEQGNPRWSMTYAG